MLGKYDSAVVSFLVTVMAFAVAFIFVGAVKLVVLIFSSGFFATPVGFGLFSFGVIWLVVYLYAKAGEGK